MKYWYPLAVPTIGDEEIAAVSAVLRSGHTTMGEQVETFEDAFARRIGVDHAVMVNSGSSADLLTAFALVGDGQIDPGAEVLVPAVTWPTHVWAWKMAGCKVRLVDVNPLSLNTDGDLVYKALEQSAAAKVLSLVHLMGVPCDMASIRDINTRYQMILIEDCCEALGASYGGFSVGTFGKAAAWSFFFSHQMTTMEGGMVTTNSTELADRLRCLRSHGWARHLPHLPHDVDPRYTFVTEGFNVRPTEVAAAIGLVQLQRLAGLNEAREANHAMFSNALGDHPGLRLPQVPFPARPSWFGLPVMVTPSAPFTRDQLAAHLEKNGVETRPILAGNLVRQPAFAGFKGKYPGADAVGEQGLYIGLHPTVNSDLSRVAEIIDSCYVKVAVA